MAQLSIAQIVEITQAEAELLWPKAQVKTLLYDSRQLSQIEDTLFFALVGPNHNGHRFVNELAQKGVENFIIEEDPHENWPPANYLKVKNSRIALQKIAQFVRSQHPAQVVAFTGSNGKTVTKEWVWQMLHQHFKICRSPKSFNSQIGVPFSIWQLEPKHNLALIETGISQAHEMARLQEIVKPQIGVFTNIGSAHSENFKNQSEKIREKLQLFTESDFLVFRKDHSQLCKQIESFAAQRTLKLLSWSTHTTQADLFLEQKPNEPNQWQAHFEQETFTFSLPFTDDASHENAFHALRLALHLGINPSEIAPKLGALVPVEMRLEMKKGAHNNTIINDSYNSDLESLRIALNYQASLNQQQPKILVISEMQQSGLAPKALQAQMGQLINHFNLQQVFAIGTRFKHQYLALKAPVQIFENTTHFLEHLHLHGLKDSNILLKGARAFSFEKISKRLEQKSHETILNIYLNRLVSNLNYHRAKLKDVQTMAMVKAFAYGSGLAQVAKILQFHGVNYLGVAYADEGVSLRQAGISLPILVLNAEPSSFSDLLEYHLEPELFSLEQCQEFAQYVKQRGLEKPFLVHLKLETGMNRLGFVEEELPALAKFLKAQKVLRVASVFSHLAAADDPQEKDFTKQQIARFEAMSNFLQKELTHPFFRHLANSAAVANYPNALFDMVRLGISLYGVSNDAESQKNLQLISELKSTISQIKQLKPGDSVSYGRLFKATEPTTIAVVSIGYADGFRRGLSDGVGEVYCRGKRYPVIGRVCMDMMMINVTGSNLKAGDEVEIFGANISIQELAEKMGTIPYEVLTGISERVKRVYFMD